MRYTPNVTLTDPKTGEEETTSADIHIGCSVCDKNWLADEGTVAQPCPDCGSKAIAENREISHFTIYIGSANLLSISEPYRKETLYSMAMDFLEKQGHPSISKNDIQIAVYENSRLAIYTSDLTIHYIVYPSGSTFEESMRKVSGDQTPLEEISSDKDPLWPTGNVQRIEPYLSNFEKWTRIMHSLLDNGWKFETTTGNVSAFIFRRSTLPTQELSFEDVLGKYMEQIDEHY